MKEDKKRWGLIGVVTIGEGGECTLDIELPLSEGEKIDVKAEKGVPTKA